ncbi:glycosyltransferase [Acinetobacter schindleri]|uniref:glycosyltransferase n=1 Tax=Acinetobacter schindleri TaxID=108981 RepID=UPI0032B5C6F6
MKILYLITGLGMGGAEKVITNLADNMVNLGHDVALVYMVGEAIVLPQSKKIDIIFLDFKKNPISALVKFIKILKIKRPNVVHSNMYHANIFSRISRIFSPFPKLISTSHSDFEGGKIRMFIYALTSPLVTISTNVSEQAKNKLVAAGAVKPNKILVINNSVDINKFKKDDEYRVQYREQFNLKEDDICLLAVGRFHPAKDYPTLIKIFNQLSHKEKNIRLFIAGDGELRDSIEAEIKIFSLEDKVTLLGVRQDIPQLMNMCDIFVSTSAWEGFGLVLAEAMACSKRVIVSKNAGFMEILGEDSKYLIEAGNVNIFCKEIENLIHLNKAQIEFIENENRKTIENRFSSEIIISKWLQLYEN